MNHLESLTAAIRKTLISGKMRLPILPESILKVKDILTDKERGAADITQAIKNELTLTAAVLRIANSSCFNSSGRTIKSLPVAIQRLGGKRTFQLLVAVSSKLLLQVNNKTLQSVIRSSFQTSQLVAVAAQGIARSLNDPNDSQAFFAGLVHNIGIPAMITAHPKEILALSKDDQDVLIESLHREVGAYVLSLWGMDEALQDVASYYGVESIDRPNRQLINYIDAANYIILNMENDSDPMNCPAIKRLELTPARLMSVSLDIEDAMEEMKSVMV